MISGSTRLAAVIGDPVTHSLSPVIHNAAFAALGLDWRYVAFPVVEENGKDAVEAMRTLGISGLSVTMPHKAAAALSADKRTPVAERLGVANCLYWDQGNIVAHSTDGDGLVASLNEAHPTVLDGAAVAVLGAGGAARSIVEALGRTNVSKISVVNRTAERADQAASLAPQALVGNVDAVASANVVINATAVGMNGGPEPDGLPCPSDAIAGQTLVVDIVYNPMTTPLLSVAQQSGISTVGGLPMLVHQAALAFECWTGHKAPIAEMTAAVASHLKA